MWTKRLKSDPCPFETEKTSKVHPKKMVPKNGLLLNLPASKVNIQTSTQFSLSNPIFPSIFSFSFKLTFFTFYSFAFSLGFLGYFGCYVEGPCT